MTTNSKKILIFGMARSGTTFLQERLSASLNITNYVEPFNDLIQQKANGDPCHWVSGVSAGVIKILSQNLDYVDLEKFILAGNFNSIIVTKRSNFADLIISLYYAENISKKYHYQQPPVDVSPFIFPMDYINAMMIWYHWYVNALDNLDKKSIPYSIFDYDLYCNNVSQTIDGVKFYLSDQSTYNIGYVSANIDYSKICLNYSQVASAVNQQIK